MTGKLFFICEPRISSHVVQIAVDEARAPAASRHACSLGDGLVLAFKAVEYLVGQDLRRLVMHRFLGF